MNAIQDTFELSFVGRFVLFRGFIKNTFGLSFVGRFVLFHSFIRGFEQCNVYLYSQYEADQGARPEAEEHGEYSQVDSVEGRVSGHASSLGSWFHHSYLYGEGEGRGGEGREGEGREGEGRGGEGRGGEGRGGEGEGGRGGGGGVEL